MVRTAYATQGLLSLRVARFWASFTLHTRQGQTSHDPRSERCRLPMRDAANGGIFLSSLYSVHSLLIAHTPGVPGRWGARATRGHMPWRDVETTPNHAIVQYVHYPQTVVHASTQSRQRVTNLPLPSSSPMSPHSHMIPFQGSLPTAEYASCLSFLLSLRDGLARDVRHLPPA